MDDRVVYILAKKSHFADQGLPYVFCDTTLGIDEDRDRSEVAKWCREQFGEIHINPAKSRYVFSYKLYYIYFRLEDDAFQFKMRWC